MSTNLEEAGNSLYSVLGKDAPLHDTRPLPEILGMSMAAIDKIIYRTPGKRYIVRVIADWQFRHLHTPSSLGL